jgi:mannose-1-phosphate guanylyltransferase
MKAILLAAGFGTRLRPITDNIPKCLVPIKGKPLLEFWLDKLTDCGINNFLINTHYLSYKVNNFIQSSVYKSKISVSNETFLLGTAGTLIHNLDYFDNNDGILIHADNYCEDDFIEFIQAHNNRPNSCLITMMTFRTDAPNSSGIIEINHEKVVIGFHEKVINPPGNLANGAIYLLSKEFIGILKIKYKDSKEFTIDILPDFIGRIYTYETKKIFLDIGTIENYNRINL